MGDFVRFFQICYDDLILVGLSEHDNSFRNETG